MITRRDLGVAVVSSVVSVMGFVGIMFVAGAGGQSPEAASTVEPSTTADNANKRLMRSSVFQWDEMKVSKTDVGEKRQIFQSPTATMRMLECHFTVLGPGQSSHAPHRHRQEELVIMKEGQLEVLQNDRRTLVGPGSVFFEGSNELHGVRNVGDTPASYFVVMFSPPALQEKAE